MIRAIVLMLIASNAFAYGNCGEGMAEHHVYIYDNQSPYTMCGNFMSFDKEQTTLFLREEAESTSTSIVFNVEDVFSSTNDFIGEADHE